MAVVPRGARRLCCVWLAILAASAGVFAVPAAAEPAGAAAGAQQGTRQGAGTASGVTSVVATDRTIRVAGSAPAGAAVDVYALATERDPGAWRDLEPVATRTAGEDGEFAVHLRRGRNETDLYYAKYLAVAHERVLGTYRYVDTNRVTPLHDYPYPETLSKKGLQVQMTDDAEELGNQHAAVNMALDQLMQRRDEGAEKTITYVSDGQEFYFDRAAVESRDRLIRALSDNGQLVNLILLVYRNQDPNSAAPILMHPDAKVSEGTVFAVDTATSRGVAHYTAAVEFLAQRYTRADAPHGRAVGFIVGNEIDAQWVWSNMGEKPLSRFLLYYERALRITELAVRKAYSHGRTYVSLTHSWTIPSLPNGHGERTYPGRRVLDALNARTKAHGDYPWNVAHHPYPEDLTDPAFWKDETATGDIETTGRITLDNIELLPRYLRREALRYRGEPRRIILSEQGCNTPGETAADERLQAACYALAYYKVRFIDGIDAFILHRHVDHRLEGGLRLGLWTQNENHPNPSSPYRAKPIHDVFRLIDTERSLRATAFAKEVIGIERWSQAVPGFDPEALDQRPLPDARETYRERRPVGRTVVSYFEDGVQGWHRSDNAASVEARDGELVVRFDALGTLWRGADLRPREPLDARTSPYLSIGLRVPAAVGETEAGDAGTRYVKLKAYSGVAVAEGVAELPPGNRMQRVTLDLSGWEHAGRITRLKIWVRGSEHHDWAGAFRVSDVVLAERLGG